MFIMKSKCFAQISTFFILVCVLLLQMPIILCHSNGNPVKYQAPKLDLSGWRSVDYVDDHQEIPPKISSIKIGSKGNQKKLVDWDDDENNAANNSNNNEYNNNANQATDFSDPSKTSADLTTYLLALQEENNDYFGTNGEIISSLVNNITSSDVPSSFPVRVVFPDVGDPISQINNKSYRNWKSIDKTNSFSENNNESTMPEIYTKNDEPHLKSWWNFVEPIAKVKSASVVAAYEMGNHNNEKEKPSSVIKEKSNLSILSRVASSSITTSGIATTTTTTSTARPLNKIHQRQPQQQSTRSEKLAGNIKFASDWKPIEQSKTPKLFGDYEIRKDGIKSRKKSKEFDKKVKKSEIIEPNDGTDKPNRRQTVADYEIVSRIGFRWTPISQSKTMNSSANSNSNIDSREDDDESLIIQNPILASNSSFGKMVESERYPQAGSIVYGGYGSSGAEAPTGPVVDSSSASGANSINDPFSDEDGIIVSTRLQNLTENNTNRLAYKIDLSQQVTLNKDDSIEGKEGNSKIKPSSRILSTILHRWVPIEQQHQLANNLSVSFSSTGNNLTSNSSSSLEAHKSASDLNYIYSSSSSPSSYGSQNEQWNIQSNKQQSPQQSYSYGYQQQAQQQPSQSLSQIPIGVQQEPTIFDTSSGATPEMVGPTEALPPIVQPIVDSYGPQVQSIGPVAPSFTGSVGSSGYGTGYSSGYSNQPSVQAPPLPPPQPVRQQPPPLDTSNSYYPYKSPSPTPQPTRQLIREEHHHHYYHNNGQRSSERQQLPVSQQAEPVRTTSIVREIQPLIINQPAPVVSSTQAPTPPPQIIREIIKEVPVVPVAQAQPQVQLANQAAIHVPTRIVQIQQPLIPLNDPPIAPSIGFGVPASAAGQIFRQISSNIPSVRVAVPQIRFPLPGLQLPVRLGPSSAVGMPLTRQTGSFVIPPMPKKTTTFLTQTQAVPTHTTIMHTTQFTPATRTTVYTTDHQAPQTMAASASVPAYRRKRSAKVLNVHRK